MDLGTVRARLAGGAYSSPDAFAADVNLIWDNAVINFRPHDTPHRLAVDLKRLSDGLLTQVPCVCTRPGTRTDTGTDTGRGGDTQVAVQEAACVTRLHWLAADLKRLSDRLLAQLPFLCNPVCVARSHGLRNRHSHSGHARPSP